MTARFQTVDPSTGQVLSAFNFADEKAINAALEYAQKTFLTFKHTSFAKRSAILEAMADDLTQNALSYAKIMAQEMGKPISEGEAEAKKCALVCRYYADNAESFLASEKRDTEASLSIVRKLPLGLILAIMPWNFPFWQVFRMAAGAFMAGNVLLLKHAMNTPQCALAIEQIVNRAGGEGLLQSLFVRHEDIENIIADQRIRGVSLTGSTKAGATVAQISARYLKPCALELGGSDPFIVFPDADIDATATAAVKARCLNSGQSCIAAKRFLVHKDIFKSFTESFTKKMQSQVMGNPLDLNVTIGPQANEIQRLRLHEQVLDAASKGAHVLCGGEIPSGPGYYYPPSVLTKIKSSMRVWHEETFGPVATLIEFTHDDEALLIANSTAYGLGATVWTKDKTRIERFYQDLDCGVVFINDIVKSDPRLPFGGTKESGYGRELAMEGILSFVNIKTVWVR